MKALVLGCGSRATNNLIFYFLQCLKTFNSVSSNFRLACEQGALTSFQNY